MYKVLIAEDEKAIRNGLNILINWEELGFTVSALVENGYQALELMENQQFDVVVTDVRMPKVDGIELIRTMRERKYQTEAIIISGYRSFDYAHSAIEYGVKSYLLKPIDGEKLSLTLLDIKKKFDESGRASWDDEDVVAQVKRYVSAHYSMEISMKVISEELHYNPAYLGRVFTKEAGTAFRDYLNEIRTAQAAELLACGWKASDIAYQVGYRDFDYFYRVFKSIYGISPSEYKRMK